MLLAKVWALMSTGGLVDVALVVLVAEPHGHADAAELVALLDDFGAPVVAGVGAGADDADIAGGVEEVVAVLGGVEAAGDECDVAEVVDAVPQVGRGRGLEGDVPRAEGGEDVGDGHGYRLTT
jgi:hypothetical protein